MPSFDHNKLVDLIRQIDQPPKDNAAFLKWIEAGQHLRLVTANAQSNEIILYGSGPYTFICSLVVPNSALFPLDKSDLLKWGGGLPSSHIAGYVYGNRKPDVWIERSSSEHGSKSLKKGRDLVFRREFEGWSGKDASYFELWQEFSHLAGIHWRPEHRAYCRYDNNGDLDQVVSVTPRNDHRVALVSCSWPKLEEYLAVSKSTLVRMYDFTLLRRESFAGWSGGTEKTIDVSPEMFYRRRVEGPAAYTRGVQIVGPRRPPPEIMDDIKNGWTVRRNEQYVEFVAHDWRNQCITKISTDPQQTTNYFEAGNNSLPFEVSPAFFRSEVLSRYKTDREKYKITDRSIECRAAWHLRGYDVNEAGQVHAYICYLRDLPYQEQLHWLAHNEEPKTGISERAFVNDFKGDFVHFQHPREEVLSTLRRWNERQVSWWILRDEDLLNRANPPLTASKEEWGNAFMDLSQLIAEGFELKHLRSLLDQASIEYDLKEQSLKLLERLIAHMRKGGKEVSLTGLRTAQAIRSKVKGHAGSSEGAQMADDAISEHGSFADHFKHVCGLISAELEMIERCCE